MADKDISSKQITKRMIADMASLFFGLDIASLPLEIIDTEQQRVEDRRADLVVRMRLKQEKHPFIFHLEIQSDNQKHFPLRMMRYFTDIALSYPDLTIRQYMLYLGKAPLNMPNKVENNDWEYRYEILDMRTIDCNRLLELDKPEAWVLAILCDFKDSAEQDVVNSIVKRLKKHFSENRNELQEYMIHLAILSENRNRINAVKEAERVFINYDETKLPSYELGWEAAEEKYKVKMEQQEQQHKDKMKQIALTLLAEKLHSLEDIAKLTGLSIEQIQAIEKDSKTLNG